MVSVFGDSTAFCRMRHQNRDTHTKKLVFEQKLRNLLLSNHFSSSLIGDPFRFFKVKQTVKKKELTQYFH